MLLVGSKGQAGLFMRWLPLLLDSSSSSPHSEVAEAAPTLHSWSLHEIHIIICQTQFSTSQARSIPFSSVVELYGQIEACPRMNTARTRPQTFKCARSFAVTTDASKPLIKLGCWLSRHPCDGRRAQSRTVQLEISF